MPITTWTGLFCLEENWKFSLQKETERPHNRCAAKKKGKPMVVVVVVVTAAGEIIRMILIVVAPAVAVQDVVAVDLTPVLNHVLPNAVNAAAVAKEAETVTVTAKERKNESDHDLARDHARHLPHDQQLHGHAQALQQQSSAIKKKNRVDKAAHQVQTKLFSLCARFKRLEIEKELYSKNCCNTSKFNNAFF